jgi:catechol 2,3-dioxygenase-like lactoylglutathione lyase family enzyme
MKRFHVHVAVDNLADSIRFYSTLFGQQPAVLKDDYAKWMVDDPRINFAVSHRGHASGVNHLGIQVETDAELSDARNRMASADVALIDQTDASCCYAKSDKYWTIDPQGIAWETYRTMGSIETFGGDAAPQSQVEQAGCCVPSTQAKPPAEDAPAKARCCG